MGNKKYTVYYNDQVNEFANVFSSDSLGECMKWIDSQLECMTPVNEENPCTDDVMRSSKTFFYELYERPVVEVVDDKVIYNEPIYSTDYYYAN